MLGWALTFLIIALVAAVLPGFGLIEGVAANIAWILFVVFVILFIVGLVTGRRPTV